MDKLFTSTAIGVLFLLSMCLSEHLQIKGNDNGKSSNDRRKRTVVTGALKALLAEKKLLVGAKLVRQRSHGTRRYEKANGYQAAVRDFNSLQLEQISYFLTLTMDFAKFGRAGDDTIMLFENAKNPQIIIYDPNKIAKAVITYLD